MPRVEEHSLIYRPIEQLPWLANAWAQWQQLSGRIGHAYLLSGPKGIGLEDFAKQLAHSVLCHTPQIPVSSCDCKSCHLFVGRQHPDFYILKRQEDKKDIAIDQVRDLIYRLNETSHQGGYKVVWIDGVEFLNQSAFNALLKSLEEPADKTLFLLTTHQVDRLPATINSRCQKISFTAPAIDVAAQWIHTQMPQADEALIKRALRLNWGAPLEALAWIEAGLFAEDQQWKGDLKSIQAGKKSVTQVVATWLKWQQPERVFDYFYQWSVSAVRSVAYSAEPTPMDTPQMQNWLRFQQAVLNAQQSWKGNANKELVLENLCLEWMGIQQSPEPLESVFTNRLQKGNLA